MKNLYCLIFLTFSCFVFSQAKKPTIMVVPSDNWMEDNGYMKTIINQGKEQYIPDYRKALLKDQDMKMAIAKINEIFTLRGFPPSLLDENLKKLEVMEAENNLTISKNGDELGNNELDKLRQIAKADIEVKFFYEIKNQGPKKYVTILLEGIDTYVLSPVATSPGRSAPSLQQDVNILLEEAVLSVADDYCFKMQSFFDEMFKNGRKITFRVKRFQNWEFDLESEKFGDSELNVLIENWVDENTVSGRFNLTSSSQDEMTFLEVRIPLYKDVNGRQKAIDAKNWVEGLQNYLKAKGIVSKIMRKGLGEAQIILGGK